VLGGLTLQQRRGEPRAKLANFAVNGYPATIATVNRVES
jgi:hypothetical protein